MIRFSWAYYKCLLVNWVWFLHWLPCFCVGSLFRTWPYWLHPWACRICSTHSLPSASSPPRPSYSTSIVILIIISSLPNHSTLSHVLHFANLRLVYLNHSLHILLSHSDSRFLFAVPELYPTLCSTSYLLLLV